MACVGDILAPLFPLGTSHPGLFTLPTGFTHLQGEILRAAGWSQSVLQTAALPVARVLMGREAGKALL